MLKVLLVMSDVYPSTAQSVRYKEMFKNLVIDYDVASLSLSLPFSICDSMETFTCLQGEAKGKSRLAKLSNWLFHVSYSIAKRILLPDGLIMWLWLYKKRISSLFEKNKYDTVIICTTPFSLLSLGKWLKQRHSVKRLLVDMSDPYSFNMVLSNSLIQKRIAKVIEKKYFPYFDNIILLNDRIIQMYKTLYPSLAHQFVSIEQGIDEEFVKSIESNGYTLGSKFTFLYAGAFYVNGRNPKNLFNAFYNTDMDVILHTYSSNKKRLRPRKHPKICYHSRVEKSCLESITASANALILMDNEFGYQIPGKTLELLALKKPLLFIYSNEHSPTLDYVREAVGVVWTWNSTAGIQDGIEQIVSMNDNVVSFNSIDYTWENMRHKLSDLLRCSV